MATGNNELAELFNKISKETTEIQQGRYTPQIRIEKQLHQVVIHNARRNAEPAAGQPAPCASTAPKP
jgi:hypothetical protein